MQFVFIFNFVASRSFIFLWLFWFYFYAVLGKLKRISFDYNSAKQWNILGNKNMIVGPPSSKFKRPFFATDVSFLINFHTLSNISPVNFDSLDHKENVWFLSFPTPVYKIKHWCNCKEKMENVDSSEVIFFFRKKKPATIQYHRFACDTKHVEFTES